MTEYHHEVFTELLEKMKSSCTLLDDYEKEFIEKILQNVKQIDITNKVSATINANEAKQNKSREAVQNAVNLLRLENQKITPYRVAKVAHISYNTAKKYLQG